MKKILAGLFIMFCLCGCSIRNNTAKSAVEEYLNSYRNLSLEVLSDLETVVENEILSDEQKDVYREIIKKQYKDLKYEITHEEYDGNTAKVTAKIKVYNFYKAQKDSAEYLKNNINEFYDDNNTYNNSKYLDFKLNKMKNTTERIDYEIDFSVLKEDNSWKIKEVTSTDLEKIHGIYNYEA